MNRYGYSRLLTFAGSFVLSLIIGLSSFQAASEDIDIFSVDQDNTVNKPNVLIILDNSANWSRQSQQWPGGLTQGQSEARAIKEVINSLEENTVNVGLMEYRTQGSSSDTDNAFLRYHIRPMNSTNKPVLAGKLDTIFNNINGSDEKRSQSNPYGNLFWDAYNYLSDDNSIVAGAGTPNFADAAAYDSQYDNFRSPLSSSDSCTRTIIIFIANNTSGPLRSDSSENVAKLTALNGGVTPPQIPFAEYTITTNTVTTPQGYTTACYNSTANCTSVQDPLCVASGMNSCTCVNTATYPAAACGTDAKFTVIGRKSVETTAGGYPVTSTTTTNGAGTNEATYCQKNSPGTISCPSSSTTTNTSTGPGANQRTETVTTTSWASCTYRDDGPGCSNSDQKVTWTPIGNKTVSETTTVYNQTNTDTNLGLSSSCSTNASVCDVTTKAACVGTPNASYDSCYCTTPSDSTGCPASGSKYQVLGSFTATEALATGNFVPAPAGPFMTDEWARFLRNKGVPLPGTSPPVNTLVTTYTLDVFNRQQNPDISALLFNTARVGGGKYFQAKNEDQIKAALLDIFTEVQAVNSAFSSASLPVNATNRAQNENQVFIGLFRPDRTKRPLWFGNLKRYQLIRTGTDIELGDKNGDPAINDLTGFITECAESFWSSDTASYWSTVGTDDPPAVGTCASAAGFEHSDLPDGPFVEKGAAAAVLRKGNNPGASPDGSGNYVVNRNLQTLSGGSLVAFGASSLPDIDRDGDADVDAADTTLKTTLANFIRGMDVFDDDGDTNQTEPRSTIHGDVVHSRPLPVNYGGTTGIVVYYGANDGTFRSVRSSDGVELWSYVAPEHYNKLERLKNNSPSIKFAGDSSPNIPKDYFFDGSTGIYQTFNADDTANTTYIYPGMRRGGRMMHAFNVSNPASPSFLWKVGCPNPIGNDTGCTTNFEKMGQTWSQASAAFIKGYDSGNTPVIIFGGGYDTCEDPDTATPTCPTASVKGSGVYVVDGTNGTLLKHFDFGARSVAADVALIDVNLDGKVDYAYAADTGGNIYRMDFVSSAGIPITTPSTWPFTKIAFTNGDNRKFHYAPGLFQASQNTVYLAIGSGDREHPLFDDYPVNAPIFNRFYVVKDNVTDTDAATVIDLDDTSVMLDLTDPADAQCSDVGVRPTSSEAGWFMDLTDSMSGPHGEQVVTSAVIVSGQVFFSTNRATLPSDTACTNSLGVATGYAMNLFNGSGAIGVDGICGGDRSAEFTGGGLPPSPVVATVEVDGQVHTVIIGAVDTSPAASGFNSAIQAGKVPIFIDSIRRPVYWFKTGDTD